MYSCAQLCTVEQRRPRLTAHQRTGARRGQARHHERLGLRRLRVAHPLQASAVPVARAEVPEHRAVVRHALHHVLVLLPLAARRRAGAHVARAACRAAAALADLGFGRIVDSEIEVPILLGNLL